MTLPQEIYDLILSFVAEPLHHSTNITTWGRSIALKSLTQCRLAARPLQETARKHLFYRITLYDDDCVFQPRAAALLRSTGAFRYIRKFVFIQSSHIGNMEPLASILSILADTVATLRTSRTLELVSLRFLTTAAGPIPIPMTVRSVIHRFMSTARLVQRLELTSIRCHRGFFDSQSVMVPVLYLDDIHVDDTLPEFDPTTSPNDTASGGRLHLVTDCSFAPCDPALVQRIRHLTIADGRGVTAPKVASLLSQLSRELEEFSVDMTHDTTWGLGMYERIMMLPYAPLPSATFQHLTTLSLLHESQNGIPYPPTTPGANINIPTTFPRTTSQFLELFLPSSRTTGAAALAPAPNLRTVAIRVNITLHIAPCSFEYHEEPWDEKYINRENVRLYATEEEWDRLDGLLCHAFFASRFPDGTTTPRSNSDASPSPPPIITLFISPFVETRGPGGPYAEDAWDEEKPLWDAMQWPESDVRKALKRACGERCGSTKRGCPWVKLVVRSERRVEFWARK